MEPEVNVSEVSRNQNSTLNEQILPVVEVGEKDCRTISPDSNSDLDIAEPDELFDLDSDLVVLDDELDPPVPTIVEDDPADRKALKSCLRSKSNASSEGESAENVSSSFPRCEGYDQNGHTTGHDDCKIEPKKKERKVRFFLLKRKAKPTRIANSGKTICLTRRKLTRVLNRRPPGGIAQGKKILDVSTPNSVEQNTNLLKVGYRRKHDTCVTQPDVSCNPLSCDQLEKTVDGEFEASGVNVEKDKPNSRVRSKGLLRQRFKDSKNLHLKEAAQKNKPTIMEKLRIVNEVPHSTLSSTIRKELEVRMKSKLSKKEKHNHAVNRPRQNVILRKSLLTNACANISTSCIPIPSDKQVLPDKDIVKTGVSSTYRNDPLETASSKESMSSTLSRQNDPEIGGQLSDTGLTVPSQGKQKQAGVLNAQKETVVESNTLESVKVDAVSNVGTSQFIEISRDSMDSNAGNLQTSSENQGLKSTPIFPASPKGTLPTCKTDAKNLEDNKCDQGGLAFLKDGKSLQTPTNLGLFNMNSSAIINNDETAYEDFGSLAQKLKRCRKSSVPVKLVKGTAEAMNSKDVEDVSLSPPETGEDIISSLSDKSSVISIENAELGAYGSGSERGISQSSISTPLVKKPRSKRERKNSKNDTCKQSECDKVPVNTTADCGVKTTETRTSASSNIVQKSGQHDSSNCNSDSRLKEEGLSTKTTSFSEEQNVKSSLSGVSSKYKQESVKHSISDLSEISKDIPKTVTAIDRKNICFSSEKSSQNVIEYLDLAGAERRKKERHVALTPDVVKTVLNMPTKGVMNTSDTKKEKEGGKIEQSSVPVNSNMLEATCSPTESVGKKIAQLSLSTKSDGTGSNAIITAEVSHSPVHSSTVGIKRKKTVAFRKSQVVKKMKTGSPEKQKVNDGGSTNILATTLRSSLSKISSSTPTKLRSEGVEKKKSIKTPMQRDTTRSLTTRTPIKPTPTKLRSEGIEKKFIKTPLDHDTTHSLTTPTPIKTTPTKLRSEGIEKKSIKTPMDHDITHPLTNPTPTKLRSEGIEKKSIKTPMDHDITHSSTNPTPTKLRSEGIEKKSIKTPMDHDITHSSTNPTPTKLRSEGIEKKSIKTPMDHDITHSLTNPTPTKLRSEGIEKKSIKTPMDHNITHSLTNPTPTKLRSEGIEKKSIKTPMDHDITHSLTNPTPTKLRSEGIEKKKSIRTSMDHDTTHSLTTTALRLQPPESLNGSVVSDLESSHSGVNATTLKTFKTGSPILKSKCNRLSANTVRKKKSNRLTLVPYSILSTKKSCGNKLRKISDRELLRKYSIKNCHVKLEKLTSEDIKRHSCFASKDYTNMSPRSALKRSPCTPSRRNASIIPENIPKLQKVMEDVITSDDESWIGWNSLITDLGQGLQLVSIMEDSKVTHTLVSSDIPDYPTLKFCDKSTDTSDLGQL